jgi:hypothetical protein
MNPASILLIGSLWVTPAQDPARFAGTWERDEERSDDPDEKIREALQKMAERRPRGGGPPPVPGGPGGPRGAPIGREGLLARMADEIHVEVEGVELRIDDGQRVQIYFLDGEKHRRELGDGTKLETVTRNLGSSILIEEKLDRGKIETKLELGEEGKTLVVTRTIRLERWKEPVAVRSVYDRVEASF